jgi:hypothetical protein
MKDGISAIEIATIGSILTNFDWVIVKQEITESKIVLTIEKLFPVLDLDADEP